MSKTTAQIIEEANATAAEITRVITANAKIMHDAAQIVANILHNATGCKNVDRLFEFAATATAAANAAVERNSKMYGDINTANSYYCAARRSASAYKAAATRANADYFQDYNEGLRADAAARREAAAEALEIVESAYQEAEEAARVANREMNAAVDDAREIVGFAKIAAAAEKIAETLKKYPETTEKDARDIIRRELETRCKDIDAATREWFRPMPSNDYVASKVTEYAFSNAADQADQDEPDALMMEQATIATEEAEHDAAEALAYMEDAQEAERKASAAALEFDHETAAAYAEQAEQAAQSAEDAAKSAAKHAAKAGTSEAASIADIASEYAERAHDAARSASETAEKSAAEAEERAEALAAISNPEDRAEAERNAMRYEWTADDIREFAEYREAIRTANHAAADLLDAYAATIGEHPHKDDDETHAAYMVARDEITGTNERATAYDREIVDAMVEAIAEFDRKQRAYISAHELEHYTTPFTVWETADDQPADQDATAEAAADAREAWSGEGIYCIKWSDGGQPYEPAYYGSVEDLTNDLLAAYEDATETHLPYAEPVRAYQRYELEAYLGEPADYDVDAIEAATTARTAAGLQYWTADAETLAAVAEAYQTAEYIPA